MYIDTYIVIYIYILLILICLFVYLFIIYSFINTFFYINMFVYLDKGDHALRRSIAARWARARYIAMWRAETRGVRALRTSSWITSRGALRCHASKRRRKCAVTVTHSLLYIVNQTSTKNQFRWNEHLKHMNISGINI